MANFPKRSTNGGMIVQKDMYISSFVRARLESFDESQGFGMNMNKKVQLSYEHEPKSPVEKENFKILQDFTIPCNQMIKARRPDIVVVDKVKKDNDYRHGNTRAYKTMR